MADAIAATNQKPPHQHTKFNAQQTPSRAPLASEPCAQVRQEAPHAGAMLKNADLAGVPEEAAAVIRRKEIYEMLHPETKNGGGAKGVRGKPDRQIGELDRFTADTARLPLDYTALRPI